MQKLGTAIQSFLHFGSRVARDALQAVGGPERGEVLDDGTHLDAAVTWLERSIAATGGSGSSHSFIIGKGWRPAYPETTGYILKTFLRLSAVRDPQRNLSIAQRLADWLSTVQLPNGGIPGLDLGRVEDANVFNTGMVLLGWNAIYLHTRDERYLTCGQKAGTFLLGCLGSDGCFVRNTSYGLVHSYNVRAAWALLELGYITGSSAYREGAERNIRWTLEQQTKNGFFKNNVFVPNGNALTHSIGYVLSGLIEAFLITRNTEYFDRVVVTVGQLQALYDLRKRIVAELGDNFEELSSHVCVVGYCQLAIVLLQLFEITKAIQFRDFACNLINDAKKTQQLGSYGKPYYGGIPGSQPIYGRYARLQYPNWAAKFFVDAILMKTRLAVQSSN